MVILTRARGVALLVLGLLAATLSACSRPADDGAKSIRLVDVFDPKLVEGSAAKPAAAAGRRTEWRFDTPAPSPPPAPAPPARPSPAPFPATRGWEAGPGITGLAIRDGVLTGRTTSDFPVLHAERTTGLDDADQLQAVEIRLRVSAGANLSVTTSPAPTVDLSRLAGLANTVPWVITTPLLPGDKVQTYTITPPAPISGPRIRHILLRPTDAAGADFAIESVRLVFRREHLASVPSGLSWQGLRGIFRETLVTRSPETVRFDVTMPSRPVLDLSIGTPEDAAVRFRVTVRRGDKDAPVLTRTVTSPYRWERESVDLAPFAGQSVSLSLSATSDREGTIAFWGAPAIRQRAPKDSGRGGPPQTVILIQGDTLRKDHLDVYGYERPTAPTLRRLAGDGAVFSNALTQTGWTKAAVPSVMTSLYPSTHGVHKIPDRLPASATTIAEVFRQAGYATASFASASFTGAFTNLHQGFEELHEVESTVGRAGPAGGSSKTAREYVDRFSEWLEHHRDVPSFVYLHFMDPHSPYEPYPPYNTLWADPEGREEYLRALEVLKRFVGDAFMADRGMPTRDELLAAGLDPAAFIRFSKGWYDGSIRGMDTEISRVVERIDELGLRDRSIVTFYADHGEEFHDHGRMWHGQSVYGEMIRVPLILWGPGRVPKGLKVEEPVELIDVMPTLLEYAGLPLPPGIQGQSLRPLLGPDGRGGAVAAAGSDWKRRPVIAEKQPQDGSDHPRQTECYAIVDGNWKLIHNVVRPPERPEYELFDFYKDPLDQQNLAAEHPDVVERLSKQLEGWKRMATQARLKPDSEDTKGMSAEQLERLRSLGYVK
jgi:arylsulfatase A-like enzyme